MIEMKLDTKKVESMFNDLSTLEKDLKEEAFRFFHDITPYRTGNAQRNTHKMPDGSIIADYPYAERLDNGWSKQHGGRGMSQPTLEHMDQVMDDLVSKIENKG